MTVSIQQIIVGNDLIRRAYEFAKKAHHGQKRKNGEPFFNHLLATAETLAKWQLDQETIAAGFLHDVPTESKDANRSLAEIEKEFGAEVAMLVSGVLQISKIIYRGTEHKVENLRKYILFLSHDIRVVFIRLASKLNTLQILYAYPAITQKRIALKAMDVYAPLAYQIGMYNVAGDLEDLAFPYLYPEDYQWLTQNVKDRFEERERYLEHFKPLLRTELEANGVRVIELNSRAKHYFSLYKKLLRYDMNLDKIYDLVAVRLIVNDVTDCYTALGVIHKNWSPLAGRIKDYIASPKPNGYQSLHTTVCTPENKTAEIQIRTEDMHREAELGIAAHFAYRDLKGTGAYLERASVRPALEALNLVKELRQFPKKLDEIGFFKDRILVLTPKGDVIDLPMHSTPIDLAYKIHSDIGNACVGAKVNGKIAPLSAELKSGDVVEIITQKNKKPSFSWLTFAKTSQAREKIRAALREVQANAPNNDASETEIRLVIKNRAGLIRELTSVFTQSKIKIKNFHLQDNPKNGLAALKIIIPLFTKERLNKITKKLQGFKEVKKVNSRNAYHKSG